MPDFQSLLGRLARTLDEHGLPFMVIGGQAVLLHGEPRLTQDIDLTLGVGPAHLDEVLSACGALELRILPENVREFVRSTFVLPTMDQETDIRVDLIFSTTPYEASAIRRAVRVEVGGGPVPFASAEDLIIHKLFAGRPRDIEDAVGVIRRRGAEMDWDYTERRVGEFAAVPGRGGLIETLAELKKEAGLS
jgi:hypothetical protein